MITLNIPDSEQFNDLTEEFITIKGGKFSFEFSLKAISEWETWFEEPFFSSTLDDPAKLTHLYKCMCLTDINNILLTSPVVTNALSEYCNKSASATRVYSAIPQVPGRNIITTEVIYGRMVMANIPFEAENWHINRLIKLLEVIDVWTSDKKMSVNDTMRYNTELNNKRLAEAEARKNRGD